MAFVTCNFSGRIGNQIFQMMATMALAMKHGVDYKFPTFTKSKYTNKPAFGNFPMLTEDDEKLISFEYKRDSWDYVEIPYQPNMRITGYFQNINYFDAYKKEITSAFNLPKEKIDAVAVHVRMGDYKRYPTKHPILSDEYYIKSLHKIYYSGKKLPVHIFSDDEEASLRFRDANEYFINGDPMEDWGLMTKYKHFIIANSTYSWTAAYLSGSDHVIAPHEDRWYGESNKHIYTGDLIPKNWVKI